jgi:tetratricopeptide (TPR) repeat protein
MTASRASIGAIARCATASSERNAMTLHPRVNAPAYDSRLERDRLDGSYAALSRRAGETSFSDFKVLVELSAIEIRRASLGGAGSDADLDRAEDESSAAAANELALLHLVRATRLPDARRAASGCGDVGRRELELAMGTLLRATREHPADPALRNTTGLVRFQLGDASGAVQEFERAVSLDSGNAEAQTNLAVALLGTEQFAAAERAYDRVLALRADDYEAHLGRALARRGQINGANLATQVASVESDLERCKELDPERPEAYFNDALLTEEYKATAAPIDKVAVLERARSLFDTFIAKAAGRPEYANEVRLAKRRVRELAPGR